MLGNTVFRTNLSNTNNIKLQQTRGIKCQGKIYKGPVKGVVLDWAGTTVDYGCLAPIAAFVEGFKRKNVSVTIEEARVPMGAHKKDHIRQVLQLDSVKKKWMDVHKREPTEKDVEELFKEFVPIQLSVIAKYADLIPGTKETISWLRKSNIKIGTTTGYLGDMMKILAEEAKKRGYEPDSVVTGDDVPAGRPKPWMCFKNAERLGIYPLSAMVKVDDTPVGVEEGLNAGMWSVGLAKSGNEIGLTEKEINSLPKEKLQEHLKKAYQNLSNAGAHYIIDSIADLPQVIDEINIRLSKGERP